MVTEARLVHVGYGTLHVVRTMSGVPRATPSGLLEWLGRDGRHPPDREFHKALVLQKGWSDSVHGIIDPRAE